MSSIKTILPSAEGEERYYGTYDLARKIEMRSVFEKSDDLDEEELSGYSWLPCCNGGWGDMSLPDQTVFGTSAKGVFDCTCYKETTKA